MFRRSSTFPSLRISYTVVLAIVLLLLANQEAIRGNHTSSPALQEFQQRVRVDYQLTDVVVRDQDGNFVRGLGADDFILYIDGKPVPIRTIEEYGATLAGDSRIETFQRSSEVDLPQGFAASDAPTSPRSFIFVFDCFNMGVFSIRAAKESARRIISEVLVPDDMVAVFEYNGSLRARSSFTSNRDRILTAIAAVSRMTSNDNYEPDPEDFLTQDGDGGQRPTSDEIAAGRSASHPSLQQSRLMENRILFRSFKKSISVLAQAVEHLPGRKILVLLSDGLNIHDPKSTIPDYEFVSGFQEIAGYIGSANASVYTMRRGPKIPEWATAFEQRMMMQGGSFNVNANWITLIKKMDRLGTLRDIAKLTQGRFFDALISDDELVENLKTELGNYYVLGFSPPEDEKGKFHDIKVETKNQDFRIAHRKGFFGHKRFESLNKTERAVHLEEGFLTPGLVNELELDARGIALPLRNDPTVIVTFSINGKVLGKTRKGHRELEMVINLEDRQGQIRFRAHKIFKRSVREELPAKLCFNMNIPLLSDPCAVYLAVRDNATGARSTWREIFEPLQKQGDAPLISEPIPQSNAEDERLNTWVISNVKDGVEPVSPVEPSSLSIEGVVLPANSVPQGEDATLVLLIGNVPPERNPNDLTITTRYFLDPQTDNRYQLTANEENIRYLEAWGIIKITASLPLGLAQQDSGKLVIVIGGVTGDRELMVGTSYSISSFSETKALELRDDPRIVSLR